MYARDVVNFLFYSIVCNVKNLLFYKNIIYSVCVCTVYTKPFSSWIASIRESEIKIHPLGRCDISHILYYIYVCVYICMYVYINRIAL